MYDQVKYLYDESYGQEVDIGQGGNLVGWGFIFGQFVYVDFQYEYEYGEDKVKQQVYN